ncbi:DUF5682 family protein [Cellulophaga sp. L1A9]|uniref:DUF5682 family protein n=1 Tax=Cellulophaga sp. L1A9 TaxID=2686362 RepID=UPI00131EA645|nr:DUF5682 family protein [Cellulophaga sp. L1A9]
MAVHILGIRHHGVGSAKRVQQRLEELKPDMVLVEGPPELTELFSVASHKDLKPPVAILVYDENEPSNATFYPFAEFSPELIAIKYASENRIPVKAIDLPAGIRMKQAQLKSKREEKEPLKEEIASPVFVNPMAYIAEAAGFADSEAWWEYQFEQSGAIDGSAVQHFEAVQLVMKSLRDEGIVSHLDQENEFREAYMRQIIRETQQDMYETIVVVCGAWHGPALEAISSWDEKDTKILNKLPKSQTNVGVAWIPWTNSRLSLYSGYGAGLTSPGWYEHRWLTQENIEVSWLTKVAKAFRKEGIDISTAHIMETYRLAEALAALRKKSRITLNELNEAVQTVMCMGEPILFKLIEEHIIVGDKIGAIPDDVPKIPLQLDFESRAKSLRLNITNLSKKYDLDLRKPLDLKRSIFFHQLQLLGITWARPTYSRTKGTFKESWELIWNPEMLITILDNAYFGNTVTLACNAKVVQSIQEEKLISGLTKLLNDCIPAELFSAIDAILHRISDESALATDTRDIMIALPGMIQIIKYGDVRKSDVGELQSILDRLFHKTCLTLANSCYGLDEESSNAMFEHIGAVHNGIKILEDLDKEDQWCEALESVLKKDGVHFVIVGCTVRLLLDNQRLTEDASRKLLSYYLTATNEAQEVAFWLEGFLRGSGLILIYDHLIWNLLYEWVETLGRDVFIALLPTLRRAFSKFEYGERRQIGNKAKKGYDSQQTEVKVVNSNFDDELASSILPAIQDFLGV